VNQSGKEVILKLQDALQTDLFGASKLAPCCLNVVEDFQFVVQHYFQHCLSGKFDFHSIPAFVLLSSIFSVDDGMAHILQSLGMQLLWNPPCSR